MPLIRGCRDRGHSWKRIAESLKKFHSGISVGKLKKYAFEIDPSLKSTAKQSGKSLIPDLDASDSKDKNKSASKKTAAVDF